MTSWREQRLRWSDHVTGLIRFTGFDFLLVVDPAAHPVLPHRVGRFHWPTILVGPLHVHVGGQEQSTLLQPALLASSPVN